MAHRGGLQSIHGQPLDAVRDTEDIPPEELLQYVDGRLQQEGLADAQTAQRLGVASIPGMRERNIAITNIQTGMLWLMAARRAIAERGPDQR